MILAATAVATVVLTYALVALVGRDPRTVLPSSWRLPLGLLAGLLAGGGSAMADSAWQFPLVAVVASFGVLLGVIDLRTKLLPNTVVLWFLAATGAALLLTAVGTRDWAALLGAAAGSATLFVIYLVLALIAPGGLGMGDVKLAAVLGLIGGWAGAVAWIGILLGGFLLGGLAGLGVLLLRRGSRGSTFPFGPGMLLATFASLVLLG